MFFDFIDLDCPICGKKKGLEQQWYFNSHGDVKFVWKCNNCGAKSDSYEVVPFIETILIDVILNYKKTQKK